jgi:hypothetical protein
MPYRRFTDSQGTTWRVWDVVPSPIDRRLAMRRIRSTRVPHGERRVASERRLDLQRSRLYFPPWERSWLCFESADVKRRLTPIPADWTTRDDAELEELCARAESPRDA